MRGKYVRRKTRPMKTLLLSILAFLGLAAFAPHAEAGYPCRYVRYYDHCGRPVYGYTYRSYSYRPAYVYRPASYYRPRAYYYDSCAPRYSYYSRPPFSIHFGF